MRHLPTQVSSSAICLSCTENSGSDIIDNVVCWKVINPVFVEELIHNLP